MSSSSVTTSNGETIVTANDDGEHVAVMTPPAPPTPPGGHDGMPVVVREGTLHPGSGEFMVGVHSDGPLDGASFTAGLMLGMLVLFIIQTAMRLYARREARGHARAAAIGPQPDDRMAAEVAALARRTATLETIVTDPAQRTAREIEALR